MKTKKLGTIFCVFTVLICGITLVKVDADSRAVGGAANLSRNGSITYAMNSATFDYYFGSAIANTFPSSGTYLIWEMKNSSGSSTLKTDYIFNPNTASYAHTGIYTYTVDGNYRHTFTAKVGAFNGSVQTTNSTVKSIGF